MGSQYFHRLEDALHGLATDPATAGDPIKLTFLFDGQDLSCNVNILEDSVDVIHVQPNHDEILADSLRQTTNSHCRMAPRYI